MEDAEGRLHRFEGWQVRLAYNRRQPVALLARERRVDAPQRQARAPRFGPVDGNVSAAIEAYGVVGGGQLERLDWSGWTGEESPMKGPLASLTVMR